MSSVLPAAKRHELLLGALAPPPQPPTAEADVGGEHGHGDPGDGSSEPLRAHIRISDDVAEGYRRELTLARPELVCAEVGQWLEEMLGDARLPPDRNGEEP